MADEDVDQRMKSLAKIWAAMLGVKKVEPDDNFFAMGGHSLLAVKLVSKIQEDMGVELELSDLFEHPTLREFSEHVAARR